VSGEGTPGRRPRYPIGVLLMAYGGPDTLEDVPGYLADIRSGRPTPRAVVEEITEHYRLIGGRSPLREHSERQRAALAARLDPSLFRCWLGMRHWSPWIEEVVPAMAEEGITHAVAVVLAPHYSTMNTERYFQKIDAGRELAAAAIEFAPVKGYHDSPPLIEALARRVRQGIDRWPEPDRERVHVVFCAHSLPARVLAAGDPYDDQLRETARLVAAKSGLPETRWSWSYMSAGRSPEPWLGPDLSDHLAEIAGRGIRDVVCVPVGFVADHVEVLHDIDIEAQAAARTLGMRLERPASLNDDPLFIEALAAAVESRAREAGFIPSEGPAR
jgi:protoporphyrin/coproporphyrin ferrochelatase